MPSPSQSSIPQTLATQQASTQLVSIHQAGWRPLLDPLPIKGVSPGVWYLSLIPLAFAVAVVYKAVRAWSMKTYWKQVFLLAGAIVAGMSIIAVGLSLALHTAVG